MLHHMLSAAPDPNRDQLDYAAVRDAWQALRESLSTLSLPGRDPFYVRAEQALAPWFARWASGPTDTQSKRYYYSPDNFTGEPRLGTDFSPYEIKGALQLLRANSAAGVDPQPQLKNYAGNTANLLADAMRRLDYEKNLYTQTATQPAADPVILGAWVNGIQVKKPASLNVLRHIDLVEFEQANSADPPQFDAAGNLIVAQHMNSPSPPQRDADGNPVRPPSRYERAANLSPEDQKALLDDASTATSTATPTKGAAECACDASKTPATIGGVIVGGILAAIAAYYAKPGNKAVMAGAVAVGALVVGGGARYVANGRAEKCREDCAREP